MIRQIFGDNKPECWDKSEFLGDKFKFWDNKPEFELIWDNKPDNYRILRSESEILNDKTKMLR